ncbi:MAG: DNA polymerase III subunit beta [Rickettsiales bacterium]
MLDEMVEESRSADSSQKEKFRIKISKKDFVKSLAHVQSVVEKRNIIPVLSNVLLNAEDSTLTITATDMDIIFSEKVSADVIDAGSVTVSAHLLYEIIRKLDDNSSAELVQRENNLMEIISSTCTFSLNTLPAKDFPKIEDDGYNTRYSLSAEDLIASVDKVKFSISNEETRYNLNGVFCHSEDGAALQFVSTDGHRLSINNTKDVKSLKSFDGVIIPRKAILELRRVIEDLESDISVDFSDNKIKFSAANFVMITKLIDAKFPSYKSLIPSDNNLDLSINREQLIKAIDRVSTINNEKFRGIKLEFEGRSLTLTSSGDAGGVATESIEIGSDAGEKFDIGFNAKYLLEIMSILKGKNVICRFKDSFSPVVIIEEGNDNYQHILMPMRV